MADEAKSRLEIMTKTPIPRLIGKLAAPAIAGMLVSAAYSLADTYFVSRIGTTAAGAVGIVYPLTAFIQAVGYTLGMGSGSLISQLLGKKKTGLAEKAASTAFFSALMAGAVIGAAGLLFLDGLIRFLGATPTIAPYAESYARFILPGAPILCASSVLNCDLRAEGRASLAMIGVMTGCILNIVLNPLLIFTFRMGIAGAGIATLAGQSAGFAVLLLHYLRRRTLVPIRAGLFSFRPSDHGKILKMGVPSLIHQGLASAASMALNLAAAPFGDAAVAAMAIVGRAFFFILAALIGFGQGFQPVAGFNYSAKQFRRLKESFRFCLAAGTAGMLALCAVGFLSAPRIMALFRPDDPQVIADGTPALRAQFAAGPLQVFVVISNMMFQSIGKSKRASLLAALRQGICFLPAVAVLPRLIGFAGVQFSQPAADLLSFLISLPVTVPFLKKLNGASQTVRKKRP
jgi:putative MATE family efflux protein